MRGNFVDSSVLCYWCYGNRFTFRPYRMFAVAQSRSAQ